ncbi:MULTISPECIES: hypothetical protein [unclassified Janthinobacterium]|nr:MULTISPECIES: hypothetical protein [unclassified Janthinobacterium]MBB5368426.1 hypothetical protein [Janthinobacterium sp. K2C7]MBB5382038.1 hypothetical protein [Janthinobacterium sp. K2Li3]MBB5386808.1 hypothetical protein [Janthinobacterium sp. K2E3]
MKKKLCAGALMLGMALMVLQLRAHAGDGIASGMASAVTWDEED